MNAFQDRLYRRSAVLVLLSALTLTLPAASAAASTADGSISVTVAGGGQVQSAPAGIDCGSTCTASFPLGSPVRLSATPASGFYVAGWSGDCVGGGQSCEATADENVRVQVQFNAGSAPTPPVQALTVSYSGEGRVTSSPSGIIDCGSDCWTSFSGGGHVTLNASPAQGFVFDGWAGDCSGSGACDVAVTGLRSVIAVFKRSSIPSGTSTLTISNSQPGSEQGTGKIRISWRDQGVDHEQQCDIELCEIQDIANNVRVTIQPLPGPNTVVQNYGEACKGTAQRCVVILSGSDGVTTSFQNGGTLTTSYGLNLTRSAGGSIQSVPPGIDCGGDNGCRAAFKRNISVRLTANAASGYTFGGWSGDCSGTSGCSIPMTVSRSVSAAFRAARAALRVVKSGRGVGSITTEPAGIDCGATCDYSFRRGTQVIVRATADRRSRFRGWGGACSGQGPCTVTVTNPVDVTAAFDKCAASSFSTFRAVPTKRALTVHVSLADRATTRVRLLRGGRALVSRTFANLPPGAKAFRINLPRRAGSGKATVQVQVKDICGRTRTLSRTVTLR